MSPTSYQTAPPRNIHWRFERSTRLSPQVVGRKSDLDVFRSNAKAIRLELKNLKNEIYTQALSSLDSQTL